MQNLNESIVVAADSLFEKFGIRSVSIDNVCTELRISKKTFYTCFKQKEELVEAVFAYRHQQVNERFAKMFKSKNAIDSLIVIITELRKSADLVPPVMCNDLEKYYPRLHERNEHIKRETIRSGFEANLRRGIAEGFYRDNLDVELISIFHSVQIKNTFELMAQDSKKYSKKRLIEFFIDLIIHVIANEKGLKYIAENYSRQD